VLRPLRFVIANVGVVEVCFITGLVYHVTFNVFSFTPARFFFGLRGPESYLGGLRPFACLGLRFEGIRGDH
jgi:hypothetical protein